MTSITHLITDLEFGGAEQALERLVLASGGGRFRHRVISMTRLGPVGERLMARGVEVMALGMHPGMPSPAGLWRLVRILGRERPAVLHCWLYHANLLGLIARRRAGVPRLVWSIRSSNVDFRRYRRLTRWVVRLGARLSHHPDVILYNSEAGRLIHESWGYDASWVRVIPNGVDLDLFHPDAEARAGVRRELGLSENDLLVGMMARFDPMKDHATFLRAAGLVRRTQPGARFLLAGANLTLGNAALARMIEENRLEGAVHLLGIRRDIPRLTAALDVACLSSCWGEGFPNVMAEALACGVPCVGTDTGDTARVVGDGGRVVPPQDPEAFAAAIRDMLERGADGRRALGLAGRQRIRELYPLQKMVRSYEELYDELAPVPATAAAVPAPRPVRVVHVTTSDLALRFLLLGQLRYLQTEGYEASGLSSDGEWVSQIREAGILHYAVPMQRAVTPLADLVSLWRIYRYFRREGFTIVHTHTAKADLLGQLAARLAGVPIRIITVHGFHFHDFMPRREQRFYVWLERIACRGAHRVLFQSREDMETARREGICADSRADYLGNGIDLGRFSREGHLPAAMALRQELGFSPEAPVVGFVGRIEPVKGFADFIEAAALVHEKRPDARFIMVGPEDAPSRACAEQMLRERKLVEYFRLCGAQLDIPRYYVMMAVLVLPSYREGVPRVVMEAAAMSLPAVVSDIAGNRQVVEQGQTGLIVPPRQPKAVAEAVLTFLADPAAAREAGQRARLKAEREFDERQVFQRVNEIYAQLLRSRTG